MKKFIVCFLLLVGIAYATPAMIAKQRREAEERARLEKIAREEEERRRRIEAVAVEVTGTLSPARGRVHSAGSDGSATDRSEASTVSAAPSAEESLRSAATTATGELRSFRAGIAGERCPSAAEVIDGLQVMTDGTKNYTTDRATLTDGKQLDLQSKFNRIFAVTADSLADIVWGEFFTEFQRIEHNNFKVSNNTLRDELKPEDYASNLNKVFLEFMKKFLNRKWRHIQPGAEKTGRRYVAFGIGLLVCSLIKPGEAATITTKAQLKDHIQRQLWLMDLLKIMRIMDQGLQVERYSDLREAAALAHLVNGENVEGYSTPAINLTRALQVLNALPDTVLNAR